jgi:DNA uptake protein ComE-like DNA-binding protein
MIDPNWKKYFYFSTKELKGLLVLGFILLGSVLVSQLFPSKNQFNSTNQAKIKPKLFKFDPNKIDSQGAILLGIPEKQVRSLMHYREKGGRFKNKDDFARLYGLTNETFQLLRPYIVMIEDRSKLYNDTYYGYKQYRYKYKPNQKFDNTVEKGKMNLNSINEQEWVSITALPLSIIKRIIAYKKYLGVYTSIHQLNKVYGMSDTSYQMLKGYLYVQNKQNELVNANALSFNDWKKLNLFSDRQIWEILRMKRGNNGQISWSELVVSFDLAETDAKMLRSKIQLSD